MAEQSAHPPQEREIDIPPMGLAGTLHLPRDAKALIVFAHGSGSSRLSPRNRTVAEGLNGHGFATLLFDLLTANEERDRANIFDIPLLADRLGDAMLWLDAQPVGNLPLGLFGASTGAAAALVAGDLAADLKAGMEMAVTSIDSGAALEKLDAFVQISKESR